MRGLCVGIGLVLCPSDIIPPGALCNPDNGQALVNPDNNEFIVNPDT